MRRITSLHLSTELYKDGASSFLDVLAAQEAYLRDSESLNQAKREHALAAVALYRSLGGGWSQTPADADIAVNSTPSIAQAVRKNPSSVN